MVFQLRVNCESIWRRFGFDLGLIWGLGRVLGGFGASLGAQDRTFIDFKSILASLVGPSRPQLGGLEASWGVLWLSLGSREPFCFPSHFRSFFGCHFASTLDPKTTPKSQKRETKSLAKTRKEKRLISMLLPLKFEEILMLKPKKHIFRN